MNAPILKAALKPRGKDERKLSMKAVREAQNGLDDTFENVKGDRNGLIARDAIERLAKDGPNEVAQERRLPAVVQFFGAFKNPFIAVLLILAGISAVTDIWLRLQHGEDADPTKVTIIIVMVLASALMRFVQEYRSSAAAEALKAMVRTTATVLRRGSATSNPEAFEIPMREIVAGDIVRLSAGDMIPADVRLIESRDLFVSQAVLTGEAIPVEKYDTLGSVAEKSAASVASSEMNALDMPNVCFMGTNVVSGTATALVVATGARTYFGSLAKAIVGSRAQTAFDRGINSVSWLLIRFMAPEH